MRKTVSVLLALLCLGLYGMAWAHPPKDIQITFDPASRMLKAVIVHDVKDPVRHFIRTVDVSLNGKEIIRQAISRQDNPDTQTVSFLIPDAKPGDTLAVEGYCNIAGKLEKSIVAQ